MWKLNASFLAAVVLALALNSNAQSAAVSGFVGTVQPIQAIGEVSGNMSSRPFGKRQPFQD